MSDVNEQPESESSFDDHDLKALFTDVAPTAGFEDRVIARLRRSSSSRRTRLRIHPIVYRSAAVAASLALVATVGYVATQKIDSYSPRMVATATAEKVPIDAETTRGQVRAFHAQQLITQAENARSQNRTDDALSLYTRATDLDPNNIAAARGRSELVKQTGRAPEGTSTLDRRQADIESRRQYIRFQFDTAMNDANNASSKGDFAAAQQALLRARVARDQEPTMFRAEELKAFDTRYDNARVTISKSDVARREQDIEQSRRESADTLRTSHAQAEQVKRSTIGALIQTTRRHVERGEYTQALGVIDQVLTIDPTNDYAVGVRPLIEDNALTREQRKYKESFERNFNKVLNEADGKKLPHNDILRYPENWPDLSEQRERSVAPERGNPTATPSDSFTAARSGYVAKDVDGDGDAAAGIVVAGSSSIALSGITIGANRFKPGEFAIGPAPAATLQRERDQEKFPALKKERVEEATQLAEAQNKADDKSVGKPTAPAENAQPPVTTFAAVQRKIIRNGTIEFEVDAFDATVSRLTAIVIEEGGFIATTNSDKLPNGKVRGVIVVRVAPDRLDALVLKLRALGDLKNQNLTAQDVSKQYSDLESELRAARAMETRLLEMIKSGAGTIKDLLAAEKELGVWREKIEKVTGEINYYNNLVSLSTLQITLTEKDIRSAAAVNETETVDMGVESEDVEKSRAETIKAIDEVKGRIVESQLKQFDAGQLAAKVVADVSRERAGETIDRLKQLGKVARLDVQRATTTIDGQPAKPGARVERADTRISVSFYNLANVAPRVTTTMTLACEDVETAYRTILERVGKATGGRVIASNINRQQGTAGASASISFETKTDAADATLADVRTGGEVMKLESTENPDTANVTRAKRGFSVTLVSTATAAPRQVTSTNIAAADVVKSYEAIVAAARKAGARIAVSRLDQQASRPTTATLDFEVRRTEAAAIDAALAGAGDAVTHNTFVNSDTANTLESKIGYHLALAPADSLPPRESIGMSIEHTRVDESMNAITKLVTDAGGRIVDSNVNQQDRGRTTAHLTIDLPLDKAPAVRDAIKSIGNVRAEQSTKNAQVPAGNLSRARIDLTIADPESLVDADGGLWSTLRRGLSTSAAGLLWSLQLIIVGVCLIAPWVIVLWGGWKVAKRMRKRSPAPA